MTALQMTNAYSLTVLRNMRLLRKGRGWSQGRLADELTTAGTAVTQSQVANWERRQGHVPVDLVLGLAEVFATTVEELTYQSVCETCCGAPRVGFICNACGATDA